MDITNPVLTSCSSDISITITAGRAPVAVNFVQPTATDNSGTVRLVSISRRPGDTFPLGNTGVSYRFEDNSGNFVICSFTVTVSEGMYFSVLLLTCRRLQFSRAPKTTRSLRHGLYFTQYAFHMTASACKCVLDIIKNLFYTTVCRIVIIDVNINRCILHFAYAIVNIACKYWLSTYVLLHFPCMKYGWLDTLIGYCL